MGSNNSAGRCPSALQFVHILLFALVIAMNTLSTQTKLAPGLFPKTNAQITDERKTACEWHSDRAVAAATGRNVPPIRSRILGFL